MAQFAEFAANNTLLVLIIMGLAFAVIAYELRLKAQGVTHIAVADAVRLINSGAQVVDVRDRTAFDAGHIVNAKHLDVEKLAGDQAKLKKLKKKTLVAVCDNGLNSGRAANALRKMGLENVFSLRGGIKTWQQENLPIVKD